MRYKTPPREEDVHSFPGPGRLLLSPDYSDEPLALQQGIGCFDRFRQGRRIIRDHFSVVFLCISQLTFLKLCLRITHWDFTLNEMVRDQCVNYILVLLFGMWHETQSAAAGCLPWATKELMTGS